MKHSIINVKEKQSNPLEKELVLKKVKRAKTPKRKKRGKKAEIEHEGKLFDIKMQNKEHIVCKKV